jgi:hypothetical protein
MVRTGLQHLRRVVGAVQSLSQEHYAPRSGRTLGICNKDAEDQKALQDYVSRLRG